MNMRPERGLTEKYAGSTGRGRAPESQANRMAREAQEQLRRDELTAKYNDGVIASGENGREEFRRKRQEEKDVQAAKIQAMKEAGIIDESRRLERRRDRAA